jgi:hypothetical protein
VGASSKAAGGQAETRDIDVVEGVCRGWSVYDLFGLLLWSEKSNGVTSTGEEEQVF